MIAHIIPLKKLPRNLYFFDYKIPLELENIIRIGSLVKIPWRNQVIFGLVKEIKIKTLEKYKLKEIISLETNLKLAFENQFLLIEKLSREYLTSPSLWWKTIIPIPPRKKTKYKKWVEKYFQQEKKIIKNIPNITLSTKKTKYHIIIPKNYLSMIKTVIDLLQKPGKHLILCPEISQIKNIISFLPKKYHNKISIIHKKLNKTDYWNNYKSIVEDKVKIILATRIGIFIPLQNIDSLIIFKSEDYSFKQADQNPRIWLHDIIYHISKNINIYFLSLAPRVENYAFVKKQKGEIINMQEPLKFYVSDMSQEYRINNYTHISWQLENYIKKTLTESKKIFLFLNKKGLAKKIVCLDCNWLGKCPTCGNILKIKNNKIAECIYCQKKFKIPASCPKCKGINLETKGITNQSIVNRIRNIFPKIPVQFIDSEHSKINRSSKIIIGTQFAYQKLDNDFKLFSLLSADDQMNADDFHGDEYAWQLFNYILRFNQNTYNIIQTWQNEYWIYEYLNSKTYEQFWRKQMKLRKKFKYPPYTKIIKIMSMNKSEKIAKEQIYKTYKSLKKIISQEVEISRVFKLFKKINNKTVYFIIIKYTEKSDIQKLKTLSNNIILDFNPYLMFK